MLLNLFFLVLLSTFVYIFGTALAGRLGFIRTINVYFRIAALGILTLPLIWLTRNVLSNNFFDFLFFDSLTHLCLGVLFSYFICLPDRALTLRILVEIYQSRQTGLSLNELNEKFSLSKMIHSRLTQMQNGDLLVVKNNGDIILQDKGLRIGHLILLGRSFFNIGSAN